MDNYIMEVKKKRGRKPKKDNIVLEVEAELQG